MGTFERPADVGRAESDEALRVAVARFVTERLQLGLVRAEDAAAHVGISVRKLHQLYAETGRTFAVVVRDMRLDEVARELADPALAASITGIAARWGFCDGAHLSRVFRRRYGCTPTEYREAGRR